MKETYNLPESPTNVVIIIREQTILLDQNDEFTGLSSGQPNSI